MTVHIRDRDRSRNLKPAALRMPDVREQSEASCTSYAAYTNMNRVSSGWQNTTNRNPESYQDDLENYSITKPRRQYRCAGLYGTTGQEPPRSNIVPNETSVSRAPASLKFGDTHYWDLSGGPRTSKKTRISTLASDHSIRHRRWTVCWEQRSGKLPMLIIQGSEPAIRARL